MARVTVYGSRAALELTFAFPCQHALTWFQPFRARVSRGMESAVTPRRNMSLTRCRASQTENTEFDILSPMENTNMTARHEWNGGSSTVNGSVSLAEFERIEREKEEQETKEREERAGRN